MSRFVSPDRSIGARRFAHLLNLGWMLDELDEGWRDEVDELDEG